MNILEQRLLASLSPVVEDLYGQAPAAALLQLQKTKKEFQGHLTLVVFPLLRLSHKGPEDTAREIGRALQERDPLVESYNVVKGFLNIVISDGGWSSLLHHMAGAERWGVTPATGDAPLVMIEYSSPNTNKPLHLGHVRNNLLGWSLAQITEAAGCRVVRTNIVNDRGIHICKSMLAWLKWGEGRTPEATGEKGDHLAGDCYVAFDKHYRAEVAALKERYLQAGLPEEEAGKKAEDESPLMQEARQMLRQWEAGDEDVRALWRKMNRWVYDGFDQTYKALGVRFDKIYYESDTYLVGKKKVEEGLRDGLFYRRDDGSVWADLRGDGLDEKLLLRADGTSVYMTQDIGTATLRFQDYPIDKMIYVVGNEQNYHFQVLSLLLSKLGFKWGKSLVHFSYGMVELPSGKMKSREGTVVDADDLIAAMTLQARQTGESLGKFADMSEDERERTARAVGLAALKYFLLKVDARKNMLFNPEESIDFNGNTGPFIQYTYARIRSIIRKSPSETCPGGDGRAAVPLFEQERTLIALLATLPDTIQEAARSYSPSLVAAWCYDVAKEFNRFYHDLSILHEPCEATRRERLLLCRVTGESLALAMGLLGIDMPERM